MLYSERPRNGACAARLFRRRVSDRCDLGALYAAHKTYSLTRAATEGALVIWLALSVFCLNAAHRWLIDGTVVSNAFNTARWLACLFAAALSVLAFCNTLKPDYLVCCLLCSLTSPCFDALRGFRWVFSAACVFVALRAIILTPVLLRSQRAQISLLSVKHALDALPDGLMFARSDGFVRLQNEAVMRLCDRIDGGTVSDATNFESYGGRWTADNGAMGRYLEFSLTDEAAGCRSGNPGEQRQRPTADISALELTAEGVYHLSVCYPGEEPDDMDNGREERWEEYYILPLENGRIAVSGEQGGSETIYYFESGQTA